MAGVSTVDEFVHLHLHTQYSLLDGAIRVPELISRCKEFGMKTVAVTDHGNMFGAIEFYDYAKKNELKPIVGVEAYIAPGSRLDKKGRADESANHLTLLAMDHTGYKNLCRLVSQAYLEGFHYKPRMDKELLEKHHEGIFCLSGCLKGEVAQKFVNGDDAGAIAAARWYQDLFGKDFYALEVMENGLDEQRVVNEKLFALAREIDAPVVATGDCHYLRKEDASPHDALLCIGTGKLLAEPNRMKFNNDGYYLKSSSEMAKEWRHYPEAVKNSLAVAEKAALKFDFGKYHFPIYPGSTEPGAPTLDETLAQDARAGLAGRMAGIRQFWKVRKPAKGEVLPLPEELEDLYGKRLEYEIAIIQKMGFSGYLLIVADFINWAKKNGIPVGPGRGSAAGSLVCYAMRITDIDPLPYNLLFERFLNPERVSMPDIDVDFCINGRGRVIEYVNGRYGGSEYVSQIITFGQMKAKAVIRDIGRVMGLSFSDTDRIAKLVPNTLNITLDQALEQAPALRELVQKDATVNQVIQMAKGLEGLTRHASVHAAGVVISDKPLTDYLPLFRGKEGETVTQFDMKWVEKVGLIKFDFLGLKNLTMIEDAVDRVKRGKSVDLRIDALPMDDEKVYDLLSSGDADGIFQLESSGMRELLAKLKPTVFEDIVALIALYRPGPLQSGMVDDFIKRKHGKTRVEYPLPQLEPILKNTYGVIVYQEQVMQISSVLAGYSLGDADLLRRAMGKKKPEEMAAQRVRFMKGASEKGIDEKKAGEIFDLMEKFAGYGFNACVTADTCITDATTGERTTVGDLFHRRRPFRIHAVDGRKIASRDVVDVHWNGVKPVFRMTSSLGNTIRSTSNHRFLTLAGWKQLAELRVGDRIASPRRMPAGNGALPKHELITLAGLLSEGNTCHPTCLYFFGNETRLVNDFAKAAACFPDTVARVYGRGDGRWEVCVSTGNDMKFRKGMRPWNSQRPILAGVALQQQSLVRIQSGATAWAERIGIRHKKATEKRIPEVVFSLTQPDLELFLGRLWAGDGFLADANMGLPFYATSSRGLAVDVRDVLLRLGIVSRVREKKFKYRGGHKVGFTVHVMGSDGPRLFLEKICPHVIGRDHQVELLRARVSRRTASKGRSDTIPGEVLDWIAEDEVTLGLVPGSAIEQAVLRGGSKYGLAGWRTRGVPRQSLSIIADVLGSTRLRELATGDVYWDTVVSIAADGVEDTYDLTVDVDHNFVANGLIVHNSHSAAYALVSYQTAYLKTHFPAEFMAALLTIDSGNSDKVMLYVNSCRDRGIPVLPPDVNESGRTFEVRTAKDKKDEIRFGLAAVKNVGEGAIEAILEARERLPEKRFKTLAQFSAEVDPKRVNKRVVESLIKCGAFATLDKSPTRASLLAGLDAATEHGSRTAEEKASGQTSLFGGFGGAPAVDKEPELPRVPEFPEKERLAFEKEALGFYITGHPLQAYASELKRYTSGPIATLSEKSDGVTVKVAGIVATLKEIKTKKGDLMAFITVEDLTGATEVTVFPSLYASVSVMLKSDDPVLVVGTLEKGEDAAVEPGAEEAAEGDKPKGGMRSAAAKILAEEIKSLAEVRAKSTREVHVTLREDDLTPALLAKMRDAIQKASAGGNGSARCPVLLHVMKRDRYEAILPLPDHLKVPASDDVLTELEKIFGRPVAQFR